MPLPIGMKCVREDFLVPGSMTVARIGSMPLCVYYRFKLDGGMKLEPARGPIITPDCVGWESMVELEKLRLSLVEKNLETCRHHLIVQKRGTTQGILLLGFVNVKNDQDVVV